MRPARGQAVVELALAMFLFGTVLLLGGLFVGEAPVLLLKLRDAARYSMQSASVARVHSYDVAAATGADPTRPFSPLTTARGVQTRYEDFEPYGGPRARTWTQTVVAAQGFRAECRQDARFDFDLEQGLPSRRASPAPKAAAYAYLRQLFRARGGVSCDISARLDPFGVPSDVFTESSLGARRAFDVCGVGGATGGRCLGRLGVLSGDWSFDDRRVRDTGDVRSVVGRQVDYPAYATAVEQVWETNAKAQTDDGLQMLTQAAGVTRADSAYLDENTFNMSFGGADRRAGDNRAWVDEVVIDGFLLEYQTSGAHLDSSYVDTRGGRLRGVPTCFLGLPGCG